MAHFGNERAGRLSGRLAKKGSENEQADRPHLLFFLGGGIFFLPGL